jgi:gas vesicle protein
MKVGYKLALGLAGGMLAGAAAGVLLAPKSGKETRRTIASGASQLWRRMRKSGSGRAAEGSLDHHVRVSA